MVKVDITGLSPYGRTIIKMLDEQGEILSMWKKLYLNGVYPYEEEEGVYCFKKYGQ